MRNIFARPQADVPVNFHDDKALLAAQKRLAELEAVIQKAEDDLRHVHAVAVADAEAEVNRAELEVLAGRGTDAQLATKQSALIAAKRERAITTLQHEDALAEKAKLEAALPGIEKAAKLKAQASIQAKYLAAAKELKGHLEAVMELDARISAIYQDAAGQLAYGNDRPADPELPSCGGCSDLGYAHLDRSVGLLLHVTPKGQAADWLRRVNEAIERVEAAQRGASGK